MVAECLNRILDNVLSKLVLRLRPSKNCMHKFAACFPSASNCIKEFVLKFNVPWCQQHTELFYNFGYFLNSQELNHVEPHN